MLFFAASLQFAEINLIPSYDRITYRRENETLEKWILLENPSNIVFIFVFSFSLFFFIYHI